MKPCVQYLLHGKTFLTGIVEKNVALFFFCKLHFSPEASEVTKQKRAKAIELLRNAYIS
jgi:hypothetical protein